MYNFATCHSSGQLKKETMGNSFFNHKTILALSLLFFASFVAQILFYDFRLTPDSYGYINTARNIADGQGVVTNIPSFNRPDFDWHPETPDIRPPPQGFFYPILIAGVIKIFDPANHIYVALLISAIAGVLALILAAAASKTYFGGGPMLIAAMLVAAPGIRYISQLALTDSLGLMCIMAFLFCAPFMRTSAKYCAAAGVIAFIAIFTRQAMLSLVLFGVVCAMFSLRDGRVLFTPSKGFIYALFCGAPFVVFALWSHSIDRSLFISYPDAPFDIGYLPSSLFRYWEKMDTRLLPFAALTVIFVWRTNIGELKDLFFGGHRYILSAWVGGYSVFLILALSNAYESEFERRYLAVLKVIIIMFSASMLNRMFPDIAGRIGKHALVAALSVMTLITCGRMIIKEPVEDFRMSESYRWMSDNLSPRDLIINGRYFFVSYYFDGVTVPWWITVHPKMHFSNIRNYVAARCHAYDNFYLFTPTKDPLASDWVEGNPGNIEYAVELKDSSNQTPIHVHRLDYCDMSPAPEK